MSSSSSHHPHHPSSNGHQPPSQQPPKPSSSAMTFPPNAISSSASVFSRMPLQDVLEDLASRFILNLPIVELSSIERVCFQVEQAHWFYEDFVRPNSLLNLPSYHLKTFTGLFFEKCEFLTIEGAPLAGWDPKTAYEKFMRYKERVPVCGAIMFNDDATQVLLVRGFKPNSSWSFPRGKINENESPRDCAIREVLEETGFNIEPYLSLSSSWSDDSKLSAIRKTRPSNPTPSGHNHQSLKAHQNCTLHSEADDHFIEITIREQKLRMYLVAGIPTDTNFVTQTRQEIGRIAWFPIVDLPTFSTSNGVPKHLSKMINVSSPSSVSNGQSRNHAKFYMVVPFVNDIRTWLTNNHLLTPVGQALSTPRALEHQRPYVQTPPQGPGHSNYHANGASYPHLHSFGSDSEAAAVHDRASRLRAFDFFQDDAFSTPPAHHDVRLTSLSKKKKRRHQQRKTPKAAIDGRLFDNPSYLSDQQTSTDEEELKTNETPWVDLEEGTRALQNFFFGSQNEEINVQHNPGIGSGLSSGYVAEPRNTDHQSSNSLTFQQPATQSSTDPAIHYQVGRLDQPRVNSQLDSDEPLSEADTDVVKGYDIATSYASSMSSSYRGPSTQIPSSDEQSTPMLPARPNNSTNLLAQILDIPTPADRANNAEAMYSKHGHLAAPRPQAAPQQVERLLAMLQAPTPGPSASADSKSLLSLLTSDPSQSSSRKQEDVNPRFELGSNTSSRPNQIVPPMTSTQSYAPGAVQSNNSFHQIAVSEQHFRRSQTISDGTRILDRWNGSVVSPAEQVTPRVADLLELLMKGGSSNTITTPVATQPLHTPIDHDTSEALASHHSVPPANGPSPSTSNPSTDYHHYHNRVPLGEEERKEKKEALIRQLHSLASLGIQPSTNTISHNLNTTHVNGSIQPHHQLHRIAID